MTDASCRSGLLRGCDPPLVDVDHDGARDRVALLGISDPVEFLGDLVGDRGRPAPVADLCRNVANNDDHCPGVIGLGDGLVNEIQDDVERYTVWT